MLAMTVVLAALPAATAAPAVSMAQSPTDPDWPCVQRLVPNLAAAAVWQGPPLPEPGADAAADQRAGELAASLLAPSTRIDAAPAAITRYLGDAAADAKLEPAARLLGHLLLQANTSRARMIAGIERFARRQRSLAEQINDETRKLRDLQAQGTPAALGEAGEAQESRRWDTRVYEDRQHALTVVCEQPVTLDRRVFALARALADAVR